MRVDVHMHGDGTLPKIVVRPYRASPCGTEYYIGIDFAGSTVTLHSLSLAELKEFGELLLDQIERACGRADNAKKREDPPA